MGVSTEQGKRILPHFNSYCDRMRDLGEGAASALATLQDVQQVGLSVRRGRE